MTTNPFFNNFGSSAEQELLDSIVVESIRQYGQDMFYLPRRENSYDGIYGEDDVPTYDTYYQIEIYIKSIEGFGGQGSFMSKFGLEIRDQIVFTIAKRTFENEIKEAESSLLRPREGDLIYFPLNKKVFDIKYVENKPYFYQLGELQMYDITCELFEYSNEKFTTGIAEIDDLQQNYSFNIYDYGILTQDNFVLTTEANTYLVTEEYNSILPAFDPLADNDRIEVESSRDTANTLINWDETNPFGGASDGKY